MAQSPPPFQIDSIHCTAIQEEIGYRLRQYLKPKISELPPQLELLLARMRQQEQDRAPSIVPSFEEMEVLEDA